MYHLAIIFSLDGGDYEQFYCECVILVCVILAQLPELPGAPHPDLRPDQGAAALSQGPQAAPAPGPGPGPGPGPVGDQTPHWSPDRTLSEVSPGDEGCPGPWTSHFRTSQTHKQIHTHTHTHTHTPHMHPHSLTFTSFPAVRQSTSDDDDDGTTPTNLRAGQSDRPALKSAGQSQDRSLPGGARRPSSQQQQQPTGQPGLWTVGRYPSTSLTSLGESGEWETKSSRPAKGSRRVMSQVCGGDDGDGDGDTAIARR